MKTYNGYLIKSKNKQGAIIIITINRTKHIGWYIPKYTDFENGKNKAITSELTEKYINSIIHELPKNKVELKITTLNDISVEYNRGIIKTEIKIKSKNLGITFVRSDKIPNFNKSEKTWLMLKRNKPLNESDNKELTVLFIKGNPKYWIKGKSEEFYNKIKKIIIDEGYKYIESESNVDVSKLPAADIYIGFSRGNGYFCKSLKTKLKIAIGGNPNKRKKCHFILVNNPDDKTFTGDLSKDSLSAHWTLTSDQENRIRKILDKFKNKMLEEVSVMGAITPVQKFEKPIYRSKFPK